jgi:uncharacterized membrane protein
MEIFKLVLFFHIACGTLGLLFGTAIMFLKKGNKPHKLMGKIFSISMLGVGFSSFALALIHRNDFLFMVGVFTVFLTGTGWRYLYLKKIVEGQKPLIIDWVLLVSMLFFGVCFIILGIKTLLGKEYFGIILIIFGWRGITMALNDYKTYKGKIELKNYWLIFHLQRMSGAYIASLTAFLVVNSPERVSFLPWLLPALIIVPFIVKWSKKLGIPKKI